MRHAAKNGQTAEEAVVAALADLDTLEARLFGADADDYEPERIGDE